MKFEFLLVWGIFKKFPVQAKLSFSSYACYVHARGGRTSFIFSLLTLWNMIFCWYGAFLENFLSKQNFPSPHMLAVCMQGEGESLSFFLRLAALCIVLLRRFKILLGKWISGKEYTLNLTDFKTKARLTRVNFLCSLCVFTTASHWSTDRSPPFYEEGCRHTHLLPALKFLRIANCVYSQCCQAKMSQNRHKIRQNSHKIATVRG